jgi:UDP-GlcNAc:undecaprenyl-phosphate/decaprenyl-phosphate GlcNAc-1-phosphate transferase
VSGSLVDYEAAAVGFAVAVAIVLLLTPGVSLAAWRLGAVDEPDEIRRGHARPTPRLGGLAIVAGVVVPALALGHDHGYWAIVVGAMAMALVGALDDIVSLGPLAKLCGQIAVAAGTVWAGVTIGDITLPLIGAVSLGAWTYPLTVLWIVALTNIVNFIDGLDGLAAGFCAIAGLSFAVLSASLGRLDAAAISAIVAGASLGFLRYNFAPASVFMGDCGSLALGYLLAAIAVQGVLKTAAAVSLLFPLVVLALPILDSSFVVLKRIKHGKPIYQADAWHLHNRFRNIGFSERRTVVYLYGWCLILSAFALAIRFVPHKHDWTPLALAVLSAFGVAALVSSVYVVYLLEILKLHRLQRLRLVRRGDRTSAQRGRAA